MICITSYNRPKMLMRLLEELQECGHRICVFDDASGYDYSDHDELCEYYRASNRRGKEFFWRQWQWLFDVCRGSGEDHFMFMPDDWYGFDIDRMEWIHSRMDGAYAFSFANKGLDRCWTPITSKKDDIEGYPCYRVGFVDGCFSTNRQTLEFLGWKMDPVTLSRFASPYISSGVGQQLSNRLMMRVPMYKPLESLCSEDPHESLMNPVERKRNPREMV